MCNSLTTGSRRIGLLLSSSTVDVSDLAASLADLLAADPGVKALVAYVVADDCVCKDLKRIAEMAGKPPPTEPCGRCSALKTWETRHE